MYEESTVNAVAEVPVVEEQVAEIGGAEAVVDTAGNTEEAEAQETTAPAKQTKAENAEFAKMRRELEKNQREKERINELLVKSLKPYFDGDDPEQLAYQALGYAEKKSPEEIRAQYQREAEEKAKAETLKAELEFYRRQESERAINEDLKLIQAIDPKIKSLDDFGDKKNTFITLRANNVDTMTAYNAIKATMPKPVPSMGGIGASQNNEVQNRYANMSPADFQMEYEKVVYGR